MAHFKLSGDRKPGSRPGVAGNQDAGLRYIAGTVDVGKLISTPPAPEAEGSGPPAAAGPPPAQTRK